MKMSQFPYITATNQIDSKILLASNKVNGICCQVCGHILVFVLVNEDLGVLYVKADVTVSAGGGGGTSEKLLVVAMDTKKVLNRRAVPSTNTQLGFALNHINNTVFMKKISEKAIVKYDGYLKKVLHTTVLENTSFWKRVLSNYPSFAEIIVVNPLTNKVYASDSKSGLLYEIDG